MERERGLQQRCFIINHKSIFRCIVDLYLYPPIFVVNLFILYTSIMSIQTPWPRNANHGKLMHSWTQTGGRSMPGPATSKSMSRPGLVPLVPEAHTCGEPQHQSAGVSAALGGAAGGRVGEQDVTFSHNISCMGTRYVFCLFHLEILCQIHQS